MYNSACCVRALHINSLQWQNVIYSNSLIIFMCYHRRNLANNTKGQNQSLVLGTLKFTKSQARRRGKIGRTSPEYTYTTFPPTLTPIFISPLQLSSQKKTILR